MDDTETSASQIGKPDEQQEARADGRGSRGLQSAASGKKDKNSFEDHPFHTFDQANAKFYFRTPFFGRGVWFQKNRVSRVFGLGISIPNVCSELKFRALLFLILHNDTKISYYKNDVKYHRKYSKWQFLTW